MKKLAALLLGSYIFSGMNANFAQANDMPGISEDGAQCVRLLLDGTWGTYSSDHVFVGAVGTAMTAAGVLGLAVIPMAPLVATFEALNVAVGGGALTWSVKRGIANYRTSDHRNKIGKLLASSYALFGQWNDADIEREAENKLTEFHREKIQKHFPDNKLSAKEVATRFILLNESGQLCPKETHSQRGMFMPKGVGQLYPQRSFWVANRPISTAIAMMDLENTKKAVEEFRRSLVHFERYARAKEAEELAHTKAAHAITDEAWEAWKAWHRQENPL